MLRLLSGYTLVALFGILLVAGVGCSDDNRPSSNDGTDNGPPIDLGDPVVHKTCDDLLMSGANKYASTVGCEFYAATLDKSYPYQKVENNFAIVVSNVHSSKSANVTIYEGVYDDGSQSWNWQTYKTATVSPVNVRVFKHVPYKYVDVVGKGAGQHLADYEVGPVVHRTKGTYRIVSDLPIIAYQFNPLNSEVVKSSDASVLIPVTSWDETYHVVGAKTVQGYGANYLRADLQEHRAFAAVVAAIDNTRVTINPSTVLMPGIAYGEPGTLLVKESDEPFQITMNQGDIFYVHALYPGTSLSGTVITSDSAEKPIGVFTGHQCAMVPENIQSCDNVEEQLPGIHQWGTEFVAARMPVRSTYTYPEPVLWQIYAAEDNTEIRITADELVNGLPETDTVILNKGEVLELYVNGSHSKPGDFHVESIDEKPIALLQYMTGARLVLDEDGVNPEDAAGDPILSYLAPVQQNLTRYVFVVPGGWDSNYIVVTRRHYDSERQQVYLDGELIPEKAFNPVADTLYDVARIPIVDGVHTVQSGDLEGSGVGLMVVGYENNAAYAYSGGMSMAKNIAL